MDDNMIDSVVFRQWVSFDRSTLETKPADEFVKSFCEKLELLLPHSFIAIQQASFYKDHKSALQPEELLVTAEFSENYSFILQDAAQGFHWNNSQATIHPFFACYIDSGELCHLSYVVIFDCLQHDTVAVHLFQKRLIAYLRRKVSSNPQKIYYFSDEQHPSTKIARISSTCAIIKKILEWMLNGIFLQLLMEKVLVMALVAQLNALLQELACKDHMMNR